MKRLLFVCIACMTSCFMFAQTESDAKRVNRIKRDKTYIWAEATDVAEQVAYDAARSELNIKVDEYIEKNNMSAEASSIIVRNIGKYVNQVSLERGNMKRVFIYVQQGDIMRSEGETDVIEIVTPTEEANDSVIVEEPTVEKTDSVPSEEVLQMEEPVKKVTEEVVAKAKEAEQIETPVLEYLNTMPQKRVEVIKGLLSKNNISAAVEQMEKEQRAQRIKNFGEYASCKNIGMSFWLVNSGSGVTVLTPLKKGERVNLRTNKVDSLDNYSNGIWFRF